jgi:hypothetical protein
LRLLTGGMTGGAAGSVRQITQKKLEIIALLGKQIGVCSLNATVNRLLRSCPLYWNTFTKEHDMIARSVAVPELAQSRSWPDSDEVQADDDPSANTDCSTGK